MTAKSYTVSAEQSESLRKLGVYLSPRTSIYSSETYYEPPVAILGMHQPYGPCEIGAFTYSSSHLGEFVRSIGRYCSIAPGTNFGAVEHPTKWLSTSSFTYDQSFFLFSDFAGSHSQFQANNVPPEKRHGGITIGNDVWIGSFAYIRGGVELGNGCVVGAHAVVTKDVPPYAIVTGNPAQIRKFRFPEATIERLQRSEWWNYKFTDFASMDLTNIDRALEFLESHDLQTYAPKKIRLVDHIGDEAVV